MNKEFIIRAVIGFIIFRILIGLLVLILAGRVSFDIPLGSLDIPITGQSLAVLLIGYYLSYYEIFILFLLYFTAGSIDLPVYADGSFGLSKLLGKSGGYLYSFPIAALVIYVLRLKYRPLSNLQLLSIFVVATAIILLVGMLHLSLSIGISKAFTYGVKPYVLGGMVKCLMALAFIKGLSLLKS